MNIENSGFKLRRRLPFLAAGILLGLSFLPIFVTPAGAQVVEDTNMVNSVLGFFGMQFDKDQDAIDYRARAPIVVPPRADLPAPKAATRDPSWPQDPDAIAERRAALDSKRPAPQITPNTRAELPAAELQQQSKASLPSDGPPDECQAGAGTPICLYAPWKALKAMITGGASDTLQPGFEPERKYLTEPPQGYRKATSAAKATVEAPKEQPDSADPKAYIRSEQNKASVN
ncbi:MAG TPA: hypothetical protein VEK34_06590 [Methylocella sp.]|nr:hypothetical protein [Methylocella sp.]